MRKTLFVLICLLVAIFATSASAAPTRYQVVELPIFSASSINDIGQVTGNYYQAAIWQSGIGITQLPYGGLGYSWNMACQINNLGQVAGWSGDGNYTHAVIWNGTDMIDVGSLGGEEGGGLTCINDYTKVAGFSMNADGFYRAFTWRPGTTITELPILRYPFGESYAYDINEAGQVVGTSNAKAVLWEDDGTPVDLGGLPCGLLDRSTAYAINDHGQVVGRTEDIDNIRSRAFIRSPGCDLIDLGTLGGTHASPTDINNLGQVVGGSDLLNGNFRAFIWESSTGMIDLNTLIDTALERPLSKASAINENGWIVASNSHRSYLLTPVPEPGSMAVLASGLGGLLLLRRNYRRSTKL